MTLKHNRWRGWRPPTPEEIAANPDQYYTALSGTKEKSDDRGEKREGDDRGEGPAAAG